MRLFVAAGLPPSVRASVRDMRQRLSRHDASVRWVRDESLHVTVKFLGHAPPARVGAIEQDLASVAIPPFEVTVAGVGFFPNLRSPRVFWAGIVSDGLAELAEAVDRRMTRLGFRAEPRAFSPHLTLARNRGRRPIDLAFVQEAEPWREHEFGRFRTQRFALYESRLEAPGAVYAKIRAFALDGGAGKA